MAFPSLTTQREQQALCDPVPARRRTHRHAGRVRGFDDPDLVIGRPAPPPFGILQQLDPHHPDPQTATPALRSGLTAEFNAFNRGLHQRRTLCGWAERSWQSPGPRLRHLRMVPVETPYAWPARRSSQMIERSRRGLPAVMREWGWMASTSGPSGGRHDHGSRQSTKNVPTWPNAPDPKAFHYKLALNPAPSAARRSRCAPRAESREARAH